MEYQSKGRGVVRYMLLDRLNRNANPHSAADDTIERLEALALEYENDAPQYAPYRICAVVEMKGTEHQSVDDGLADELAAIHDTLGRGLARRFSATADEAQRALGAIVDRLRSQHTDCGTVDGGIEG